MEKINIAELLKDCPKGMELDCTMFDDVKFIAVDEAEKPICIRTGDIYRYLTKFGTWTFDKNAKCVIFPKGKTTWEGFQRPYTNGDIVYTIGENIAILGDRIGEYSEGFNSYCGLYNFGFGFEFDFNAIVVPERLATEEEKAKLFKAIKDKGYRWNSETKTLKELVEPKFKVGDRITLKNYNDKKPIYKIIDVKDTYYATDQGKLPFYYADSYELVPDKFDITTLKSFDKVLVRDNNKQEWVISLYSHCNGFEIYKYSCINGSGYSQCIPYKNNEHLLGTTDDCDEYFKTWK